MPEWLKNGWNNVTGWFGKKTDQVIDSVADKTEKAIEEKTKGMFGGLFDNFKLGKATGGKDGFLNWKSGIGGAVFGLLGYMLSGVFGFIAKPFVWIFKMISPRLGTLAETLTGKFTGAAGGAFLGMTLTNAMFAEEKQAPPVKDNIKHEQKHNMQPQKTPQDIVSGLQKIFADKNVSAEEIPELKSLLAAHKQADPQGYAQLENQIVSKSPTLAQQLGLN